MKQFQININDKLDEMKVNQWRGDVIREEQRSMRVGRRSMSRNKRGQRKSTWLWGVKDSKGARRNIPRGQHKATEGNRRQQSQRKSLNT